MSHMFQDLFMPIGRKCSRVKLIWWQAVVAVSYGSMIFFHLLPGSNHVLLQILGILIMMFIEWLESMEEGL